MRQHKQNFLQGTVLLAAGTVLVKVLGAIFKIPLTNRIGEVGIGYFNTAYQLYLPIYTLATAGLPVAVSRMVAADMAAKRFGRVAQLRKMLLPIFLLSGAIGTAAMWLGAKAYTQAVGGAGAVVAIRALAPTVLFCTMMSALRGYYAGLHDLIPTAVSQVIEAVVKLGLGLLGAEAVLRWGMTCYERTGTVFGIAAASEAEAKNLLLPIASGGAILGVTVGAAFGLLYLLIYAKMHGNGLPEHFLPEHLPRRSDQLADLLHIAMPVCIGALVVNIGALADAALLQNRLAVLPIEKLKPLVSANVSDTLLPAYLYGCYTMAQSVAMLVPTVAQSVSVSALPGVTAVWTEGKRAAISSAVANVLRITAVWAFPAGFGLLFMAKPILLLLYAERPEGAATAVPALQLLGLTAIGMTLSTAVNSMLQAVGRADIPVKWLLVGMTVKIAANAALCSLPQIHMLGACVGSLLCYGLLTVGGFICLLRVTRAKIPWTKTVLFPMLSGVLCGLGARTLYAYFGRPIWAMAFGGLICLAVLLLTHTLTVADLRNLFGRKFAFHLEKKRKMCYNSQK